MCVKKTMAILISNRFVHKETFVFAVAMSEPIKIDSKFDAFSNSQNAIKSIFWFIHKVFGVIESQHDLSKNIAHINTSIVEISFRHSIWICVHRFFMWKPHEKFHRTTHISLRWIGWSRVFYLLGKVSNFRIEFAIERRNREIDKFTRERKSGKKSQNNRRNQTVHSNGTRIKVASILSLKMIRESKSYSYELRAGVESTNTFYN